MTGNFFESETKENLMRAFAGESQARNRYTIAAEKAREKGMYTIADIFLYTAEQERAHAERFYELLKEFTGSTIQIDGTYPVDQQERLKVCCVRQSTMKKRSFEDVYPSFGNTAKAEGFLEAASASRLQKSNIPIRNGFVKWQKCWKIVCITIERSRDDGSVQIQDTFVMESRHLPESVRSAS